MFFTAWVGQASEIVEEEAAATVCAVFATPTAPVVKISIFRW